MRKLSSREIDQTIAALVDDSRPLLLHEAAQNLLTQNGQARYCIVVDGVIRKTVTAIAGEISELREHLKAAGVDKAASGIAPATVGRSAINAVCTAANEALDNAAKQLAAGAYKNADIRPFRKAIDDVRQSWLALLEENAK